MTKAKAKGKAYQPSKLSVKKDFKKNWVIYLMFLPLAVYYIIFNYIPMVGITMAFQDYKVTKGLFGSDWVGLANFQKLFTGNGFLLAFRNTACMAVMSLVMGFLPPIILALLFSECKPKKFKRVTQIMCYMPNSVTRAHTTTADTKFGI